MNQFDILKSEQNIYMIYRCLNKFAITKNEHVNKVKENKIIESLNPIEEKLYLIENSNPMKNGKFRKEYCLDRSQILNKQVEKKFCYIYNGKKSNSLETSIQRHIYMSENYNDVIGIPIIYELPLQQSKNTGHIDLITYKKNTNELCLIEFKKCTSNRQLNKSSDEKESNELLIRAMFEISTYYSYFINILNNPENGIFLKQAIIDSCKNKLVDISFDNLKIKKVILGPKRLFNTYSEVVEKLKQNYELYTIELNDNISNLNQYLISCKEALFKIEKI